MTTARSQAATTSSFLTRTPFAADTEVTGPIRAEIFVSADVRDFDLWVRLLDVAPDGTAFNLMSPGLDVLRASYRNASLKPELLTPGKVYLLALDRMVTSNVFARAIASACKFPPRFHRISPEIFKLANPKSCLRKRSSATSASTTMRNTLLELFCQ